MRHKVFRPTLDDIESLSHGKRARQRGTGSKYVAHRLNQDERRTYNSAKQDGYMAVRGTGYRKNRKGCPAVNTFRQRCDALETICVVLEKYNCGGGDKVCVDFSTLRVPCDERYIESILGMIRQKYAVLWEEGLVVVQCAEKKIDWELVKAKSIWNIEERIVMINGLERDVAKSLVISLLKESEKFDQWIIEDLQRKGPDFDQALLENENIDQDDHDKIICDKACDNQNDENQSDQDEKNEIDWDDI